MGIPAEIVILNALSDDDETIDSGIKNDLNFFEINITDELLINTLDEMLKNELIHIVFVEKGRTDRIFGTWFRRTDKGTKMWNEFRWDEYKDYIIKREIELYGN